MNQSLSLSRPAVNLFPKNQSQVSNKGNFTVFKDPYRISHVESDGISANRSIATIRLAFDAQEEKEDLRVSGR